MTEYTPQTRAIFHGRPTPEADAPFNPPIVLASSFHAGGPIGYGRYGNQTWTALEEVISSLEGGKSLAFASGMGAISAVFSTLPIGAHVIASHQGYSGTMALLRSHHESGRLDVEFVDTTASDQLLARVDGKSFLWLESPTNPMLDVVDLPHIIRSAKSKGAMVGVDNTFATPLTQRPLQLGADVVVHSLTKYLAGHSDVILGSISTASEELFAELLKARSLGGAIPGPFEAWLALRGLRTFVMRYTTACSNAITIAERLASHPAVAKVRYPGLATDPGHERAKGFMESFGAVISFEVRGGADVAEKVVASSTIIGAATSLGGVETTWERRRRWPAESQSVPDNLIRLSVGCEGVEDLWKDIESALKKVAP